MILMVLEIETFKVEVNFDKSTETYGYKAANYYKEGFIDLEEAFNAIEKEINLLVEDYGTLCCFPNYKGQVAELIDFDEF